MALVKGRDPAEPTPPGAATRPAGRVVVSLQYARALAAIAVVVAHLGQFPVFNPLGLPPFGGFGVDLFFVISGFIMWTTAAGQPPNRFVLRRLIRIVPMYWAATTLLVAIAIAAPRLAPDIVVDAGSLLGSYLFVPYADARGVVAPLLQQGWTLNLEMGFYAVFALGLCLPARRLRFWAVALVMALLALLGLLHRPHGPLAYAYTDPRLLEFCLGMGLAAMRRRLPRAIGAGAGALLLGAVGLLLGDVVAPSIEPGLLRGLPAALFVLGLLIIEPGLARRPFKPGMAIGDASYSLFLLHPFILKAVALAAGAIETGLGWPAPALIGGGAALLALGVAIGVALACYRFIERPVTTALGARIPGARLRAPFQPAAITGP